MHNFLEQIRSTLTERLKSRVDLPFANRAPTNFLKLFTTPYLSEGSTTGTLNIIPEIKFASPSVCQFQHSNPLELAKAYVNSGAKAISIVTEPYFFSGTYQSVIAVRTVYPELLILMKDFVVTEQQLLIARGLGADAVLLIAALLTRAELKQLYEAARHLGLTPLVEVHTQSELQEAETLKAQLIGVNNRDLKSLQVKPETTANLIAARQSEATFIALSGISNASEIRQLSRQGYHGLVMGSHLLHAKNPGEVLAQLIAEVQCDAR